MKMTRLFSWPVRLLAFGAVLCLPACLGTGQGTGAPEGAVFSADAGSKTEAGPDIVQEDSKPHPSGVSAPLNEWEGEGRYIVVVRGGVSRCFETLHRADGTDVQIVKSRVSGQIFKYDTVDGVESPYWTSCSLRYLRVTEGGADALQCTDILLKTDCRFEKEMEIADPGSVGFHLAMGQINLLHPEPYPACAPPSDPDFIAVKNELDFSGLAAENPPSCEQESQQGMMIKPFRPILKKLKNVLE